MMKKEKQGNVQFNLSLNDEQLIAKDAILKHPYNFVIGNAGSGKTLLSTYIALQELFKNNVERIVITRPTVGTEDIGFLPGTLEEKLEPWLVPIRSNFRKVYNKPEKLKSLEVEKKIEMISLQHFRGQTFENAICILDECFPKNTNIVTSNGIKTISSIIKSLNKGNEIYVLTYNSELDVFEHKPVIGSTITENREIYEVSFKDMKIKCTDNHKILTVHGYKMANELKIGDVAIFNGTSNKSSLFVDNNDIKNILIGSLMGDGYVQNMGFGVFRFRLTHGIKQSEYCKWKIKMLHGTFKNIKNNGYAQTESTVAVSKSFMVDDIDLSNKSSLIDLVTWQSFAITWMDDGSMSKLLNAGTLWSFPMDKTLTYKLSDKLNSMGLETRVAFEKDKYYVIRLNKKSIYILSENIAQYVHSDLSYKIHSDFRHLCNTYNWNNDLKNFTVKPFTGMKSLERFETVYDIEVADNHNFIVQTHRNNTCGIVVHNCQNLTKSQLRMAVGRLGKGSIMIFCGDFQQIDLKNKNDSAIYDIELLKNSPFVNITELIENHRNEAVSHVLNLLK